MNYFRNYYAQSRTYLVIAIACAIVAMVSPVVMYVLMSQPRQIIIMDAAGNYHMAVGQDIADAQQLQANCVKAAVLSLFTRTPSGVTNQALLKQVYLKNCDETIEQHLKSTKAEFELKKIRQTAEVQKIRVLNQGNGRYLAHAQAYLTRACEYMGEKYVENRTLTLSVLMVENPDISQNGKLPLAVVQIVKCQISKVME